MRNNRLKKILVAETPAGLDVLRRALDHHYDLIFSTSLHHASQFLDQEIDVVVCGLHFDDSRMLDLLVLIKSTPSTRATRFICLNALDSVLTDALILVTEKAVHLMGGEQFIELSKWRMELGDDAAFRKFRLLIDDGK